MRLTPLLLVSCIALAGCNRDMGYQGHDAKHFNAEDRRAIEMVENSPLGIRTVMRQIVDQRVLDWDDAPLDKCEYSVSKMIERDPLPVRYEVTCITHVGDSPDIYYVWDVEEEGFEVVAFRWGFGSVSED